MTDPKDLVSIYRAAHVTEAHFVKNLLADEDIAAYVAEEFEPLAGLSIDPPEVLVRKEDEARARQIVTDYDQRQMDRAERADWKCPKCGARVVGAFDECDVCGTTRPGMEEPEGDEEDGT